MSDAKRRLTAAQRLALIALYDKQMQCSRALGPERPIFFLCGSQVWPLERLGLVYSGLPFGRLRQSHFRLTAAGLARGEKEKAKEVEKAQSS